MCLAADTSLTADPGGVSLIPAQYHILMKNSEYDQEILQSQTADKHMASQ